MGPRKNSTRGAGKATPGKTPGSPGGSKGAVPGSVDAILDVIRAIPRGKTAAYGQIATMAGNPRGARQVARVLHALSEKRALPWHRVVNRSGRISLPMEGAGARQAALLRAEGVAVSAAGKVAAAAAWRPEERGLRKVRPYPGKPSRRKGEGATRHSRRSASSAPFR